MPSAAVRHDIKTAGSLSLAVSLPTMLVAFARYSRDRSFTVLRRHARLAGVLAAGSIVGTVLGGLLLGVVPEAILVPGLAARTERLKPPQTDAVEPVA